MKSIIMTVLLVTGIVGLKGRQVPSENVLIQGGNLLISEIMYDPDPAVGLPPYEYVEWCNTGADTVDLTGWQWVVGDKARRVAGGRVSPGGFVIVCPPAAAPSFREFGTVIALESFPALRNTGDRLSLVNPAGVAVHTVEYSPDQFADALKANGGWSLELADRLNYCSPAAWIPSADPSGGTPGRANSQQITIAETEPPMLIRAAGYDGHSFVLLFSGALKPQTGMNNYTCLITPGAIAAPQVPSPEFGFPGLFFQIPDGLDPGSTYTVDLAGTLEDCSGRGAKLRPVAMGFPSVPDSAEVVITEIMFDPQLNQTEFVEVFNRSGHVIDLKDLILARANPDGTIISFSDQQDISYWLFPECYAVFTASCHLFMRAWPRADPAVVAERPDLPPLTNGESGLILMDRYQKRLDAATYSPDWHYPYLEEKKGVSLERVDFGASGTDRANWFSASAASGYSTPGSKNSSSLFAPSTPVRQFRLDPATGYSANPDDPVQVVVRYRFEEAGWFMCLNMYSAGGLPVAEIFPFGLAAVEGVVCWDGLDASRRVVPDGIYLVVADYFHPSGKKGRWKKACAIVRAY